PYTHPTAHKSAKGVFYVINLSFTCLTPSL
ncbi:MAG: hypothetical protein ACJAT7_001716, partial [Psychromonas sp.]